MQCVSDNGINEKNADRGDERGVIIDFLWIFASLPVVLLSGKFRSPFSLHQNGYERQI